jgi:hypothetical protein
VLGSTLAGRVEHRSEKRPLLIRQVTRVRHTSHGAHQASDGSHHQMGHTQLDRGTVVTLGAGKVQTRTMVRAKSDDANSDDIGSDESGRLYETEPGEQEQDPISALHDTGEESGDEAGLMDTFRIDSRAARELGVELDSPGGQEIELD